MEPYLASGEFIDSSDADVRAFAQEAVRGAGDDLSRAVQLYYAVRDGILYDPYYCGDARSYFRASDCLRARRGFCIPKAALLAAAARSVDIPARVGYADVRNHLSTKKLLELIGTDLFIWHSFTELYLEGRWVKATPAFNLRLCERFGVRPLEFDGTHDSLFHEYDQGGRRHMEYVRERGNFPDVPYESIIADFNKTYPRWRELAGQGGAKAPAEQDSQWGTTPNPQGSAAS
ncbi:MAG TPA: transglutaminase-like domain-containing protein [Candidatus Angelobacter sp.]|nr:transglutaminase-like domain-containing protein [Candidatus Angelobacter sp.]